MARRSRPPVEHVARDPEDVLHVPTVEGRVVAPPPAPPEPEMDSVSAAAVGGADPSRGSQRKAATGSAPRREARPAGEKTLHELNLEARAIDRYHASRREEAKAAAREHVDPILSGVLRPRLVPRRTQRNLRPPVRE
jgi:hypothetical protein